MNDDLEPRLRDAMHRGSLPPAPPSLVEALLRVPDAPVRARRRGSRPLIGLLAAAVVLVVASALALTGGSPSLPHPLGQTPVPSGPAPSALVLIVSPGPSRLHLEFVPVRAADATPDTMAKLVAILETRVATTGVAGPTVSAIGSSRVVVELPGVTSSSDPRLTWLWRTGQIDIVGLGDQPAAYGAPVDLTTHPPLFGDESIVSVSEATDQTNGPVIDFMLTPAGATALSQYTAAHVGSYLAIAMDGKVLFAPVIQDTITGGQLEITLPGATAPAVEEVPAIVAVLQSGPLPFAIQQVPTQVVPEAKPSNP